MKMVWAKETKGGHADLKNGWMHETKLEGMCDELDCRVTD